LNRDGGGALALRRTTATLTLLSAGSGGWALQPPADDSFTTVVLHGGAVPSQVEEALGAAQARVVWSPPDLGVVVVGMPPMQRWMLYQRGPFGGRYRGPCRVLQLEHSESLKGYSS